MYLRAARSMAAFVGMCDGGSPEDGCYAASRDDTTINALELLHENNYDTAKALQALVKNPIPKGIEKKWCEEDQKRFLKGLRQFGKNFFKIRKEHLPHKETSELVEFYYLWKKSPQAVSTRFHRRHRRTVLRRVKTPPATAPNQVPKPQLQQPRPPTPSDSNDLSSVSDGDEESDDSDSRDLSAYSCTHCSATNSKDWHHGGKNNTIICTECRLFWKKNGEMRPLDGTESPFLFKPVPSGDDLSESVSNGKHVLTRTRGGKGPKSKKGSTSSTGEGGDGEEKNGCKSPTSTKRTSSEPSSPKPKKRKDDEEDGKTESILDAKKSEDDSSESSSDKLQMDVDSEEASKNEEEESPVDDMSIKREAIPEDKRDESPAQAVIPSDVPEGRKDDDVDNDNNNSPSNHNPSTCPPLITPKVEPSSSPPPLASSERSSLGLPPSGPIESRLLLPNESPLLHRPQVTGSPVRVKEERGAFHHLHPHPTPSSPSSGVSSVSGLLSHRPQSPSVRNRSPELRVPPGIPGLPPTLIPPVGPYPFPFGPLSQGLSGRLPSPSPFVPLPRHDDREREHQRHRDLSGERERDKDRDKEREREKDRERRPSSSDARSKTPRDKNAESPRPPNPLLAGWPGFPGMMPGMMPPTSRPGDPMMPPTSMASFLAPSEQRLPPAPGVGHPFGPPPFGHPLAPHPGNPFAFLPPGMPPYFTPPWAFSPRLGFPPSIPSPQGHPPSSKAKSPAPKEPDMRDRHSSERRDSMSTNEEDDMDPTPLIARGPSPEPKVEDSECHRSQSAIFLKHWNRGDFNSCARTDLTFKPVPDSQLARKREERARKAADKEREEQKKLAAENRLSGGPGGHSDPHSMNPFDRPTSRMMPGPDTPALRQLSEYARPHGLFSPGFPRTSLSGPMPGQPPTSMASAMSGLGLPPGFPGGPPGSNPSLDLLHYQIASGMYGPIERARLEAEEREKREIEKREREMKEMEMKSRFASQSAAFEAQMADLQRRYGAGAAAAAAAAAAGHPSGPGGLPPPFGLGFPPGMAPGPTERERLGVPPGPEGLSQQQIQAEQRLHSERLAALSAASAATNDPVVRLQMANLANELHNHAHTHAHTHAHAHTHLHLHPHDPIAAATAAAAAAIGMPEPPSGLHTPHPSLLGPSPSVPPGLRPPPAPPLGPMSRGLEPSLMHPSAVASAGLLRPNFDEQLAHQLSAIQHHEQMQRQFMMERERLMAASGGNPHPF